MVRPAVKLAASREDLWQWIHLPAADICRDGLRIFDVVNGTSQKVAVENDQVGKLVLFERAYGIVKENNVGVVDGVEADGLLAGQGFFGMKLAVEPAGAAGERDPHAEE